MKVAKLPSSANLPTSPSRSSGDASVTSSTTSSSSIFCNRQKKLDKAKELIQRSYDLIWRDENADSAIVKLHQALLIQREFLGKHHKDVAWTCNWIGCAYWKCSEPSEALKYFFEARRIFCKGRCGPIRAIDERIRCILSIHLGLTPDDVELYHTTLKRAITHELMAEQLRASGREEAAKREYRLAKATARTLDILVNGDRAGI